MKTSTSPYEVIEHILSHCEDGNPYTKTITKQQSFYIHNMVSLSLMSVKCKRPCRVNTFTTTISDMYKNVF